MTDEQLASCLGAGQHSAAVGELFNRYRHLVFGVCRKYLGDADESYDMTIAVFEKLLVKPPDQQIKSFKTWLYVIVRNECLSACRNRGKSVEKHKFWLEDEKNASEFMENEGFLRLMDEGSECPQATLDAALGQLAKAQKDCIEAFYFKEKSYKETAELLGLDVASVKSHLQNGKRKLAQLLQVALYS